MRDEIALGTAQIKIMAWKCTNCGLEAMFHETKKGKHIYLCNKCLSKKLELKGNDGHK